MKGTSPDSTNAGSPPPPEGNKSNKRVQRSKHSAKEDVEVFCGLAGEAMEILEDHIIPIEFVKHLPSTKHRRLIGFVSAFIMFALFVGFTAQSYITNVTQQYISLTTEDGVCQPVSRPLTGKYLISTDGYWEGAVNFRYSHALMDVQLNNFIATLESYTEGMWYVQYVLEAYINGVTMKHNLAWNLLLLMEQQISESLGGYTQTVSFTATPASVFSADYINAALASREQGPCPVTSHPTANKASALLESAFDLSLLSQHCNETYPPLYSGSNGLNETTVNFVVDMNSFSTATAINMGFSELSNLEQVLYPAELVHYSLFTYPPTGDTYRMSQMINPSHQFMTPIFCIFKVEGSIETFLACVVRQDYMFFLPILNHVGGPDAQAYGVPQFCNCSSEWGASLSCDTLDMMGTLIFDRTEYLDITTYYYNVFPLIKLLNKYNISFSNASDPRDFYRQLAVDAYEASLYTLRGKVPADGIFLPTGGPNHNFDGAFDFCQFDCSLFVMRFTDIGNVAISPHAFNLFDGSCSAVLNFTNWDLVAMYPPAPLVETYYKCTQLPTLALYNALGISMGIVSLILTAFAFLLLPVVLYRMNKHSKVGSEKDVEMSLSISARMQKASLRRGYSSLLREHKSEEELENELTLNLLAQQLTALRHDINSGVPCDMNDPLQALAYNLFERKSAKVTIFDKQCPPSPIQVPVSQ